MESQVPNSGPGATGGQNNTCNCRGCTTEEPNNETEPITHKGMKYMFSVIVYGYSKVAHIIMNAQ